MNEQLRGKIILFDGDSICHATSETEEPERGWAYRIGAANDMNWHNAGISGATITAEMYSRVTGAARHWVSRNIDTIHENFPHVDYLILEGGTNDADLIREFEPERMGSFDPDDYSGRYDDTTFCGALESLFFKALNYYPYCKIGYIVAPKMGAFSIDVFNNRRFFFEKAMGICRKWGIPYIDLWQTCPINPRLKVYYDNDLTGPENKAAHKAYLDGQHLTADGYDRVSGMIEEWLGRL